MDKDPKLTRAEWIDSIPLRGKVFESKPGESITLKTEGALVTVHAKDIRHVRDISETEKEVFVASTAKITYETVVGPAHAQAILSREGLTAAGALGRFAGGECECSRCSGGECECSRCTGAIASNLGRFAGGECECSRCIDGPCECSRCASVATNLGRFAGGECECSRCSGGECECSRCTGAIASNLGRFAGGECECSRCIDGPCECSRCVDASSFGNRFAGGFRRRIR